MPKINNLKYICNVLSAHAGQKTHVSPNATKGSTPSNAIKSTSKHHFLFLLGTDTTFTETPTIGTKFYQRGESLSYTAQAITTLLGETAEKNPNEDLSYKSHSVDILNGPTTRGTEVYTRVAQAILLVLQAAADGKETLQIAAHSRGAVEAVLLMHELEQIKKELSTNPNKSLFEILTTSNKAMAEICTEKPTLDIDNQETRAELLKRLNQLKINSFLIDPVPGDTVFGIPGIAWHDERFYEKLPDGHHELLLCRDERSACFYPIVPEGMVPLIIPGHHGTPTGNLYDQQYQSGDPNSTYIVQDLVLTKLLNFIDQTTDLLAHPKPPLNLKHEALDALVNQYLSADNDLRAQLLLQCYEKVAEKDEDFLAFRQTNYPLLAPFDNREHRHIHFGKQDYTTMVDTSINTIFNAEYANHLINKFVRPSKTAHTIADSIKDITYLLTLIITDMKSASKPGGKHSNLLALVRSEKTKRGFFNALAEKARQISQQYLSNQLSLSDQEAFVAAMSESFLLLKEAHSDQSPLSPNYKDIIAEFETIFKDSIQETADINFRLLGENSTQLYKQIQLFLAPVTSLDQIFQSFVARINTDALKTTLDHDEQRFLIQAVTQLRSSESTSLQSIKESIDHLMTGIEKFAEHQQEGIRNILFGGPEFKTLSDYVEAHQYHDLDYLKQIEQQYNAINQIIAIRRQLQPIVEVLDIKLEYQLMLHKEGLILLAGQLLQQKKIDLETKPTSLHDDQFFELIKQKAINLEGLSPEMVSLQHALLQLKQRNVGLERESQRSIMALEKQLAIEQNLNHQILTENEFHCAEIVYKKLLPLTQKYLNHLLHEAKRYYPGSIHEDNLPNANQLDLKMSERKAYKKIRMKLEKVFELYRCLEPKPNAGIKQKYSERILAFTTKLNDFDHDLKQHRDEAWKTFIKNCLIAIAILATGIIPGVVGLIAYSKTTGRSPLFFTKSKGQEFITDVEKFTTQPKQKH